MQERLIQIYSLLEKFYGKTFWWPAESSFEVMVGAILTQNTNWRNVEKSLYNLKNAGLLDFNKICGIDDFALKELIKPSGFYNLKTKRLKNFVNTINKICNGNIERLKNMNFQNLRKTLLEINGIGKETADSILLYALDFPVFVVDAYTKRLFKRLGINLSEDYDDLQNMFHKHITYDVEIYKEYHALIVNVCKDFCRKKPKCEFCPLKIECNYYNSHCWSGDRPNIREESPDTAEQGNR
ncbi:MAG: endonuclease related protein [Deferribacteres bacterium]|nr:HhH-GPD family protein [Deferribacteraceae bacterium]MDK2791934.1 endonuclease related protein [Deferribacteres bacterium]